jgi:hypothetical protein
LQAEPRNWRETSAWITETPLHPADHFVPFSSLQQRDWDWPASKASYDTDGCGVSHSLAWQSRTILKMSFADLAISRAIDETGAVTKECFCG